ncbi:hypothetical protein H4R18_001477 [Coemansia javaensis]|uniref:BZIP domain-containing protein n=1 Tax=Coemansia javaensis TaxID=2761396 RepID=A0A9W8LLJ3_9FUNG|nr:hypothetical protein H4R18_001477 [Coemansia javaensis]
MAPAADAADAAAAAGSAAGGGAKRKLSAGEIDLSLLGSPRPGRPCREAAQDPALQEARKRARVLRNRAAAQLSREKKRQHLEQLEQENNELRIKNVELERRLGRAESANAELSARLDGLARQLQGLQALLLDAQRQAPPAAAAAAATTTTASASATLEWAGALVASPLHNSAAQGAEALDSIAQRVGSLDSSSSSSSTGAQSRSSSLTVAEPEAGDHPLLLSAIVDAMAPAASAAPSAATGSVAPKAAFGDAGDALFSQFIRELGLALVEAWLRPATRPAAALRRVVGAEPVERVHALAAALLLAARTATSRRRLRLRFRAAPINKRDPLIFPP